MKGKSGSVRTGGAVGETGGAGRGGTLEGETGGESVFGEGKSSEGMGGRHKKVGGICVRSGVCRRMIKEGSTLIKGTSREMRMRRGEG